MSATIPPDSKQSSVTATLTINVFGEPVELTLSDDQGGGSFVLDQPVTLSISAIQSSLAKSSLPGASALDDAISAIQQNLLAGATDLTLKSCQYSKDGQFSFDLTADNSNSSGHLFAFESLSVTSTSTTTSS